MTLRERTVVMAFVLPLSATACSNDVPDWCVAPEPGMLRVATSPAGWEGALELIPAWRFEGATEGAELLWPVDIALHPDVPLIALADFGLSEVVVLSTTGEWVGRWGRQGTGPGELARPAALAWLADGSLAVYDPGNARVVVFDSAATVVDEERVDGRLASALGGGASWIRLGQSGTLLAQPGAPFRDDDPAQRTFVVVRARDNGAVIDTIAQHRIPVATAEGMAPVAAPGWPRPAAAAFGDSIHAVAGHTPDYAVRVYRDDSQVHVICRDVEPIPFTTDEVTSSEENVPDFVREAVAAAPEPDSPAAIGRLVYDATGRLWVERTRPRALSGLDAAIGRPGAVLDVYDADGAWLGEVRMPANVRFLAATHDLIVGLESSDVGVLSLVAYRPG